MKCLLVGNYGAGNIGDEALRDYFLAAFPEIEWTVVSADSEADSGKRIAVSATFLTVPRLPLGIRSLFRPWWKTLRALKNCNAVVFGGGSLFTDIESVWACILWRSHAAAATFFGKPYLLTFQGVGPFRTTLGRRLAEKTFRGAAFISVRDAESRKRVEVWKASVPVIETFDPAYALFAKSQASVSGKAALALIPRGNSDDAFFVAASGEIVKPWDRISILLLEPGAAERGVAEKIKALAHGKAEITEIRSVRQLLEEISKSTTVVSQRYHGALAALAMGKHTVICPQQPGDKLDALRTRARDHSPKERLMISVGAGEDALRRHFDGMQRHDDSFGPLPKALEKR